MRSWFPIPANALDRQGLLGEHHELHAMGASIEKKGGYYNHPETQRWIGHSHALKARHDEIAGEMTSRGYNHKSPWPEEYVVPSDTDEPPDVIEPIDDMKRKLAAKLRERSLA
jgi:hypothetical protein